MWVLPQCCHQSGSQGENAHGQTLSHHASSFSWSLKMLRRVCNRLKMYKYIFDMLVLSLQTSIFHNKMKSNMQRNTKVHFNNIRNWLEFNFKANEMSWFDLWY